MERFFSHYLKESDRYELLAENLQLIENKVTIGELDFLIRDTTNQSIIHLEIACKFYIHRPKTPGHSLDQWIGPNRKDRLVDKLQKLRDRQFPLLNHPIAQEKLKNYNLEDQDIQQMLFLPGLLFSSFENGIYDNSINPEAVQGYWLSASQFEAKALDECQLAIPEKENWLVHPSCNEDWFSPDTIIPKVKDRLEVQRSPMIWLKRSDGLYERFFVLWW